MSKNGGTRPCNGNILLRNIMIFDGISFQRNIEMIIFFFFFDLIDSFRPIKNGCKNTFLSLECEIQMKFNGFIRGSEKELFEKLNFMRLIGIPSNKTGTNS